MLANTYSFLLWGHLIVGLHSKLHFIVEMLFLLIICKGLKKTLPYANAEETPRLIKLIELFPVIQLQTSHHESKIGWEPCVYACNIKEEQAISRMNAL